MASSLGPIGSDLGGERAPVASALLREPDRRCRFAPARGRGVATFSRLEEQYRRNGVDIEKGFGVVVIGTAPAAHYREAAARVRRLHDEATTPRLRQYLCGGDRSVND